MFGDILDRKQAFLDYKISILPSRQIRCFLRGWSKILVKIFNIFLIFFSVKK